MLAFACCQNANNVLIWTIWTHLDPRNSMSPDEMHACTTVWFLHAKADTHFIAQQ